MVAGAHEREYGQIRRWHGFGLADRQLLDGRERRGMEHWINLKWNMETTHDDDDIII